MLILFPLEDDDDGIDLDGVLDLYAGDENSDMGEAAGDGNGDEGRLGVYTDALRAW